MVERGELVERLEKATGPDRELDEAIRAWEVGATIEWQEYKKANAYHRDGSWVSIEPITPVTASLDAAIALVERVLPGVWYTFGKGKVRSDEPLYGAQLWFGSDDILGEGEHNANLPLAICIALLKAGETQ